IGERYGVRIRPDDWTEENIPEHLRPRVEVRDNAGKTIAAGRNWENVAAAFRKNVEARTRRGIGSESLRGWQEAAAQWERPGLTGWSFGDLPETIRVGDVAGIPVE